MSLTVTDILKFRESESDPWQRLLLQANINFNLIYPVGSIYMSTVNVDPGTIFGGTWEQLKDTFLLGAGDSYTAGDTGGEATHTLTKAELPNEKLDIHVSNNWLGYKNTTASAGSGVAGLGYKEGTALKTSSMGSGSAHNNMPPYIVVYMWKRLTLSPSLTPLPMNVLGEVASEDIVPIAKGGTGADNAADARTNLGIQLLPTVIVDNTSGNSQDYDKTYTVSGAGVIVVFAGSMTSVNDYGSWSVQIYHNNNLIMAEGTRWGTALSQPKGASAGVPISVSSGDKIRVRVVNTIADSISVFRRFLCFGGCSVS